MDEHRGGSEMTEPFDIRATSAEAQRTLTDFHASVADHIAAIQAAGREIVAQQEGETPTGIRVEIEVGPDPTETSGLNRSVDCWDEQVICGKGASGYIYCTIHVCMTVGPVTVLPG
jgi:hypothetical protein